VVLTRSCPPRAGARSNTYNHHGRRPNWCGFFLRRGAGFPTCRFLFYRLFSLLECHADKVSSGSLEAEQNEAQMPSRNPCLKEQKMNKMVLFILLALSSAPALSSANSQIGKVTRLMTKDLPDLPGKEGMVETVDFAPGEVSQPHRHNADLFVYVLEGSIITQVKGGSPQTVHAGEVFYESPTDVHIVSRNASETQPAKLLVFYVKAKGTPPTVLLGEGER
jgi:quercetin dioxygenase-like cupin family protein